MTNNNVFDNIGAVQYSRALQGSVAFGLHGRLCVADPPLSKRAWRVPNLRTVADPQLTG